MQIYIIILLYFYYIIFLKRGFEDNTDNSKKNLKGFNRLLRRYKDGNFKYYGHSREYVILSNPMHKYLQIIIWTVIFCSSIFFYNIYNDNNA